MGKPTDHPPIVIANPRHDADFRRAIAALADVASPQELERALRPTYPSIVVRARDLSSEPDRVWYAYRDGHWLPSLGEDVDE